MDLRKTPPSRPPNPALPYREDCWSEGETSVLIDAWGDLYVELNRGNLRQKQWQEVADAVNSRPCDARRPPRTDVQCKNRIDTLKKKYKVEKTKIADGAFSSPWIFYDRLDELIGPSSSSSVPLKKSTPPPSQNSVVPLALPLPSHRKGFPLPTAAIVRPLQADDSFYRKKYSYPLAPPAAALDRDDESDSDTSRSSSYYRKRSSSRPSRERFGKGLKKRRVVEGEEDVDGMQELSKVITRLGEIYEKVEMEKQKQMRELEEQRIEFAKSLEVQRMQMFMDMQVELMKMERGGRRGGGSGGHSSKDRSSSAVLPLLYQPVLL